ncbi:MAG: hypothetical protein K5776_08590 [Lachnospiraceae bacterium]|nr:hypothetical protein [Lachnospiraceae bacterium]
MNYKAYLKGLGIGIIVTALVLIISGKMTNKVSDEYVIKRAKELGMTESTTLTAPLANDMGESAKVSASDDKDKETSSDTSKNEDSSVTGNGGEKQTESASSGSGEDKNKFFGDDKNTGNNTDSQTDTSSDNKEDGNDSAKVNSDTDKNTDGQNSDTDKNTDGQNSDKDKNTDDTDKDSDTGDTKPASDKTTGNVKTVLVEVKSGQSSETVSNSVMNAGLAKSETEFNKYLCENGYDKRLRVGSYNIPVDADFETISKYLCGMMNINED